MPRFSAFFVVGIFIYGDDMQAVSFKNRILTYIDQRFLPAKVVIRECRTIQHGYNAIKELRVRGAPLLGIFACYTVCAGFNSFPKEKKRFLSHLSNAIGYLKSARPTAVNLAWALDRLYAAALSVEQKSIEEIKKVCIDESIAIHEEDNLLCKRIAENGARLIPDNSRILTHCNTGFLATGGGGTALGVIYKAHADNKNIMVYIDETRPLLQGARLTAWELTQRNVKSCLITDNMAGLLMKDKTIDLVIVGADRIALNGDTANKTGTYGLSVLAHYHRIPFYVAAPFSTFDPELVTGEEIPIEERNPDEVKKVLLKLPVAPLQVNAYNPAFDVTPGELITAFITDRGIFKPPYNFLKNKIG
jgi:methylthioribose-1-phosphate isomerase